RSTTCSLEPRAVVESVSEMRKGVTREPNEKSVEHNHRSEEAANAQPAGVKNYITPRGLQRLKDELKFLLIRERPAVTQVVAGAGVDESRAGRSRRLARAGRDGATGDPGRSRRADPGGAVHRTARGGVRVQESCALIHRISRSPPDPSCRSY